MRKFSFGSTLMATTVLAGLAATPAHAQDTAAPDVPVQDEAVQSAPTDQTPATQETPTDSPATTPAEESQDIVVTGSRIVSPNITSLSPVQVVGETEIDQSGAINVQQVLLENPAFGTPGLARTNSAFLTSGAGVATVDLRDLGSDRTLVLINGRRVVAGLPGSATVDLNVIPTQFVERIDVLTGGASSLYGSDAIAGVVNFIYKRNFEGLLVEGQYGNTQKWDAPTYQISLTGGGNFADDRGNVMVHLGYTKEGALFSRERKNTQVDDISLFQFTGNRADYTTPVEPFFSSFVPGGRFTAGSTVFGFDPQTNELFPCFATNSTPACTGVNGGTATGPFGFNRQAFRTLAVPVTRYVLATRGTFDIADNIGAYVEGTYVKTRSSREIEPFALDSDDIIPGGVIPIETLVNGVPVLNPLVPTAIANAATDRNGDGTRDILFARRLSEVGSRSSESTRDFFRAVVGLEGKLLDDKLSWDVSYNYGETTESQTSNGQVNVLNFRNALAAVPDTGDVDGDGNTTEAICADPVARTQGCVPINIFGAGSISPEALQYVNAEGSYNTRIRQQVLSGSLSGTVVELPAGPLGFAIGGEYRKESSSEDLDALTNAGLNAGNALPDTEGSFNVKEAFAEVNVPILRDQPFAYELNLRAAGRISDYSTVGNVKTYSLGADYSPISAVRFRGTYAKATRAPNVGELFTGPSQTFPSGLSDPCEGIGATGGGSLGDRCRADPGVAANIAANGVFTLTQADRQGISGFNTGNPDLGAERSRSITAGVVINPRSIPALRNFVFSADYYNIKVKDSIVSLPRQFTLNQCFQQGVQSFCDLITRRAGPSGSSSAGSLEFIDSPLVNGGALKVEGIDFVATYRVGLGGLLPGWNANARLAYTRILDAYSIPSPGAEKDPFKGEIGTARDRANGTVGVSNDLFGLSLTGTFIGRSSEDDQFLAQFGIDPKGINIPRQFYLDAQAKFTPTKNYEIFAGVDNLTNNKAPAILSGSPFNITGSDTAADVYDIFGRRFYAGARLRF